MENRAVDPDEKPDLSDEELDAFVREKDEEHINATIDP